MDYYRWLLPLNEPLSFAGFGWILSAPTVAAAEPPTGRLLVDPYRWRVPFNERLSPVSCGRILSAPTVWVGKLLPFSEQLSCVHFGRLRASPTGLRSFRFSLCTLPGGSENQRIDTSPVRHCPAALPPAFTASKCFADYQLLCELLILRLEIRIFYGYNGVCVFCNR